MANLNSRLENLEKSIGVSGQRPVGMTDAQFLRHLSKMPRAEYALFLKAMPNEELKAVINYGCIAIEKSMSAAAYQAFIAARNAGNYSASITILKQHIEQGQKHGND